MGVAPFRRAFLGERAVAELVMLAVLHFPEASLRDADGRDRVERQILSMWERTVVDGFTLRRPRAHTEAMTRRGWAVWWTVCLPWGAYAVTTFLLELWRVGDVDVAALHDAYGWRSRGTGTAPGV